jgi:hypothetical protein
LTTATTTTTRRFNLLKGIRGTGKETPPHFAQRIKASTSSTMAEMQQIRSNDTRFMEEQEDALLQKNFFAEFLQDFFLVFNQYLRNNPDQKLFPRSDSFQSRQSG